MDLVCESHEYFQMHAVMDNSGMPMYAQSVMSAEMSRVTMRLTGIMAWLMARKSVLNGDLDPALAAQEYRLEGQEFCLSNNPSAERVLPEYMCDMLDRSLKLYARIHRLDQEVYDAEAA
jgi:regulator of CtrA degradation